MHLNGTIRISWLRVDAFEAVVGISNGTYSPVFKESYFSKLDFCPNRPQPPKIGIRREKDEMMFLGPDNDRAEEHWEIRNEGDSELRAYISVRYVY